MRKNIPFLRTSALLALALATPLALNAVDKTWLGSGNNWGNGTLWDSSGVPGAADDIYFSVASGTYVPARLNGDREANSINFEISKSGDYQIGAGTSNQTLTLTSGNITRLNANTGGGMVVGDRSFTGGGIMTLATSASGFTFSNERGNNFLYIQAVVSGSGKTVTIDGSSSGRVKYIGSEANTYTGTTTITNSGTLYLEKDDGVASINNAITLNGNLYLAANNQIGDSAQLNMSGGTFYTDGFSEDLGMLNLAANSVLDMGSGGLADISFSDSSSIAWASGRTLSIYNWLEGTSSLFFGTDADGLTESQLLQIAMYSDGGSTYLGRGFLNSDGSLTSVPEPSTYAIIFGALAGLMAWTRSRSRKS